MYCKLNVFLTLIIKLIHIFLMKKMTEPQHTRGIYDLFEYMKIYNKVFQITALPTLFSNNNNAEIMSVIST